MVKTIQTVIHVKLWSTTEISLDLVQPIILKLVHINIEYKHQFSIIWGSICHGQIMLGHPYYGGVHQRDWFYMVRCIELFHLHAAKSVQNKPHRVRTVKRQRNLPGKFICIYLQNCFTRISFNCQDNLQLIPNEEKSLWNSFANNIQ